jgi:hypothetical protein
VDGGGTIVEPPDASVIADEPLDTMTEGDLDEEPLS